MQHLCTSNAPNLGILHPSLSTSESFSVLLDAPVFPVGVHKLNALPSSVGELLNHTSKRENDLSFVFAAQLAGASCTLLWDSGAKLNFVSTTFVKRFKLHTTGPDVTVQLANGNSVQTKGHCTVKLSLQNYHSETTFKVLDLAPGFNAILGDEWS
jgi:hypothetical protein